MTEETFDATQIERPDPMLMKYYFCVSLFALFAAPLLLLQFWFRYVTLRYKFDDSGVSMRWGVLFRREIYLTYRRIQDIHLTRNLLQRWMGLAKISLQTAAGSSQAEMAIEGILDAEGLRDFLYARMRGARNGEANGHQSAAVPDQAAFDVGVSIAPQDQRVTQALVDIRDALQKLVDQKTKASNSGSDS